jgi:hypothetical protein
MKKILKALFSCSISVILILSIIGCGSSMYNYRVEPTPIKKGTSKYNIKNITLSLQHGDGRNIKNKTFKNELELKKSFKKFINKGLKARSIKGGVKDLQLDININYKRTYNWGGNSLNKPEFSYSVNVYNSSDKLLVDFSIPLSKTKHAYFKENVVLMKIAAFQWDAENEPEDIELISKLIVEDLFEIGN